MTDRSKAQRRTYTTRSGGVVTAQENPDTQKTNSAPTTKNEKKVNSHAGKS